MSNVLIIDDKEDYITHISDVGENFNIKIEGCTSLETGNRILERNPYYFSGIILDAKGKAHTDSIPTKENLYIALGSLSNFFRAYHYIPTIILTGFAKDYIGNSDIRYSIFDKTLEGEKDAFKYLQQEMQQSFNYEKYERAKRIYKINEVCHDDAKIGESKFNELIRDFERERLIKNNSLNNIRSFLEELILIIKIIDGQLFPFLEEHSFGSHIRYLTMLPVNETGKKLQKSGRITFPVNSNVVNVNGKNHYRMNDKSESIDLSNKFTPLLVFLMNYGNDASHGKAASHNVFFKGSIHNYEISYFPSIYFLTFCEFCSLLYEFVEQVHPKHIDN